MMKTLVIDLYTGKVATLPQEDFAAAIEGLERTESPAGVTYKGEEYIVVVLK